MLFDNIFIGSFIRSSKHQSLVWKSKINNTEVWLGVEFFVYFQLELHSHHKPKIKYSNINFTWQIFMQLDYTLTNKLCYSDNYKIEIINCIMLFFANRQMFIDRKYKCGFKYFAFTCQSLST